ncbi:MAG: hypothetical protein M1592_05935 [Candidatus Thermoplasmatota archaeon]|jgi:DNA repair ATPase RecN|nr:hypothetical protein [Candidatus Thermoplasmatota archaeon]
MNGPMLKLPHNTDELLRGKQEAEDRIMVITRRESDLKQEYATRSMAMQDRIKKLNAELKAARSELNKFQRENRSARRRLAEERLRLTKDLKTLNSRYAGMISRTRKKVSENPEEAFKLMEVLK